MAQAKQQAALKSLWADASKRYKDELKRLDDEYQKKHLHVWNINRRKKPSEKIPVMYTAEDFAAELEKNKTDFRDMRMKGHGVFKAMNNLALPVEIIGGQAAAIGSMFNPAAPMVFGAVMYLFQAGKDVHESYDTLEKLFNKCTEAITDISAIVKGKRTLEIELQNVCIDSLIAILDVFRIAAGYARNKRWKAYGDALAHPGKGGPEGPTLDRLKDLNARRDTNVIISTLVTTDRIEFKADNMIVKQDRTLQKMDVFGSGLTDVLKGVTEIKLMQREKEGDKSGPTSTLDAKQKNEDNKGQQLRKFLAPEVSVSDRAKEFPTTTAPGTCEWIFSEPNFEKWKTEPDVPILWIYGDSGVGKSHLAGKIVEHSGPSHLLGAKETTRASVAAYFVEYEDGETAADPVTNDDKSKKETVPAGKQGNTAAGDETNGPSEKAEREPKLVATPTVGLLPMEKTAAEKIVDTTVNSTTNQPTGPANVTAESSSETAEVITAVAAPDAANFTNGVSANEQEITPPFDPTIAKILRTMAWQLCEDDKYYEKFLSSRLTAIKDKCTVGSPISDIWKNLYIKYFSPVHGDRFITLVIDGVDNLPERSRKVLYNLLIEVVKTFNESKNGVLRFICLSQPTLTEEISNAFSSHFHMPSITINKEKSLKDIETYISWTVEQSPKLKRALRDQSFRQETVKKLAGCTEGVFEMSALLLKQLAQKDHVDLFSEALAKPPTNIEYVLTETLKHFGDTHTIHDIKDLNTMLSWVLYAYSPLSLAEMNAAIGVESEHGEFLDIRDRIEREFSAYFSVVDLRDKDAAGKLVKPAGEAGSTELLETEVVIATEKEAAGTDADLEIPLVKVAHASIAKFFRNSESFRLSQKNCYIGVNRAEAHLRLAKTCLQVVCYKQEENTKAWKSISTTEKLIPYATGWFSEHLKEGKSAATLADKIEVFRLLARLFRDETVISKWVRACRFWPDFFDLNKNLGMVWSWFSDEEVLEALSDQEKHWVLEPCPSTVERILRPIAMWYAKNLLQDPAKDRTDDAMYFFVYLNSLVSLFERSKIPPGPTGDSKQQSCEEDKAVESESASTKIQDAQVTLEESPPNNGDAATESQGPDVKSAILGEHPFDEAWKLHGDANAIRKIAEWAGFEKTALWYTRTGYIVTDTRSTAITEESLANFKTALTIDPDFGAAHFVLGQMYGEMKEYDLAIKSVEEARRVKYNESEGSMRRAAISIARWQEAKEDVPGATEEAKEAGRQAAMNTLEAELKKKPSCGDNFDLIAAYITVAGKSGKHKLVMSALFDLGPKVHDFICSEAINLRVHQTMRRAAEKTRRVGYLKKAYEIAIEKDKLPNKKDEPEYSHIDMLDSLASLFVETQEDEKALKQYKALVEYAEEQDVTFYASGAQCQMAALYLLTACSKGSTEEEKKEAVEELIKLEKNERDEENKVRTTARTIYGVVLGFYYKLIGESEKAHALFKDRVEVAMVLLDDDDADNDWQAWETLMNTLFKDGDLVNGRAAAGMFYKELRKIIGESDGDAKKGEAGIQEEKTNGVAESAEVETNGNAKTGPTSTPEDAKANGSKDDLDASPEKVDGANPTSKNEPDASPTYEDTPWQMGPCDGICNRDLRDYDKGVYICIYCTTTWFCSECYSKHLESPLPYMLCDSDHEFAYATGMPKEVGKDDIWADGKVRDRMEWLDEIRVKWGLPAKKKEEKEVEGDANEKAQMNDMAG